MSVLDRWFLNDCTDFVYSTDCLGKLFSGQVTLPATVGGMLAIKARSKRSDWVRFYWFRPLHIQEIAWAGNPDKPVTVDQGVHQLSPRSSFEKWVETRTGYSRPWANEEKVTAAKFRNTLMRWL